MHHGMRWNVRLNGGETSGELTDEAGATDTGLSCLWAGKGFRTRQYRTHGKSRVEKELVTIGQRELLDQSGRVAWMQGHRLKDQEAGEAGGSKTMMDESISDQARAVVGRRSSDARCACLPALDRRWP